MKNKTLYTWAWNCEESGHTHINTATSLLEIIQTILNHHLPADQDYQIDGGSDYFDIKIDEHDDYLVANNIEEVTRFLTEIFQLVQQRDEVVINEIEVKKEPKVKKEHKYIWAWHCDVSECAFVNTAKSLKQIIKIVLRFNLFGEKVEVKKDGSDLVIKINGQTRVIPNDTQEVSEFLQSECNKRDRNDHFEIKFL